MTNKSLIEKINLSSNMIHRNSVRGVGDYIIVNSEVAEKIRELDLKHLRKKKLIEIENKLKTHIK